MQQYYRNNSMQSVHHSSSHHNVSGVRMLNSQDADILLSNFPPTRLSYEVSIHKNDTQSILPGYTCFILPKGRRCIAWATEWKRNRIFAVIEIDGANSRQDRDRDRDRNVTMNKDDRPVIRKFHQENGWYPGRVRIFDACFDRTLVYGTVFGGVMFRMNSPCSNSTNGNTNTCMSSQFFSIHNIYWYKGNPVPSLNSSDHINLCEELFYQNNIRQIAYTNDKSVIFGLPILCNTVRDAEQIIRDLPYEVFALQYRYRSHNRVSQSIIQDRIIVTSAPSKGPVTIPISAPAYVPTSTPTTARADAVSAVHAVSAAKQLFVQPSDDMLTNIQATFIVRPNIQNDIYELFVLSDNYRGRDVVFHNFAHIPGYKTSIMMNRLFRNIIENERLDTMEESEDETEFENTEPDKYVTLTKEYKMICRFNKRFCKWVPVELAMNGDIITYGQVRQHEMRYINYRRNK